MITGAGEIGGMREILTGLEVEEEVETSEIGMEEEEEEGTTETDETTEVVLPTPHPEMHPLQDRQNRLQHLHLHQDRPFQLQRELQVDRSPPPFQLQLCELSLSLFPFSLLSFLSPLL